MAASIFEILVAIPLPGAARLRKANYLGAECSPMSQLQDGKPLKLYTLA